MALEENCPFYSVGRHRSTGTSLERLVFHTGLYYLPPTACISPLRAFIVAISCSRGRSYLLQTAVTYRDIPGWLMLVCTAAVAGVPATAAGGDNRVRLFARCGSEESGG